MNFRQVHLDFHTSEKISGIGTKFDKIQFQEALKEGHVNSITLFSKCHHGWAYHPSEANEIHPELSFDLLKAQIDAAHKIGVKTPVYISAGFDEKEAIRHPEWLYRNKDDSTSIEGGYSNPGYHMFCMNTPYLDYLLAQIKEVVENYDADGIFLDIVAERNCCCSKCIADMRSEGLDPFDDANIAAKGIKTYAEYTRKVRETIDSVKPGLPVFHNGGHIIRGRRELAYMNSHLELESLPTGGWGYDHFPLSSRYSQQLGMEYLGMTGKFHKSWGEFGGFKHPNALRYEASLSVANGAKCSIGDQLHPHGCIDMNTYKLIGTAYREIEEKEPWLDNVCNVADVGILSPEAVNSRTGIPGSMHSGSADLGAVRIMLEGHYLFDVLDCESDFNKYKVIILPDDVSTDKEIITKLKAFISSGGKILASGNSCLGDTPGTFTMDFGIKDEGVNEYSPDYMKPNFKCGIYDSPSFVIYSGGRKISLNGGKELAQRENSYFNRTSEHFCSHLHTPSSGKYAGPGMVLGNDGIYIAWNIFSEYATMGSILSKEVVIYALNMLLGDTKTLCSSLPAQGVTTLMNQECENRYISHMLYAVPVKRGTDTEIIEDIIPIYNVKASYMLNKKIKRVYLAPQMKDIDFEQKDDRVEFTVPKIDCHQMIVMDY